MKIRGLFPLDSCHDNGKVGLTDGMLLACFVPRMRYNTGFKKEGSRLAIYRIYELPRSAWAAAQLQASSGWLVKCNGIACDTKMRT